MKKNVWLWNHYATDMYKNHGGRHYWFAKNLLYDGYDVTIFCANTYHNKIEFIDTNQKKYIEGKDEINNINFVFVKTSVALGNGINRVKNMWKFYRNLFPTAKEYALKYGKPDVILASSVHPLTMLAGIQIAQRMKIPCICEVRDLWPEAIFSINKLQKNSFFGKLLTAGEHWIYKKSDALIFTKEGDTDYIKEQKWDMIQGGDIDLNKAYYINNGVDIKAFDQFVKNKTLADEDLESKDFLVVYTGAIRPVNNIDNLLDSAALLKQYKDIRFLIYGDGNQKGRIKRRIAEEKLTNVKLKGFVNKQYIPYILSKASVNVLNYSQDQYNWTRGNSSNKLFEYMASGKPIISTVKMGYSIINKYHCGIELDECTPQKLAEAVLKIKNMEAEQYNAIGMNARKGVKDFDSEALTKRLIGVIENLKQTGNKND